MSMSCIWNRSKLVPAAATLAAILVFGGQARAVNDLVAGWTFEEGSPTWTPPDVTDASMGPIAYAASGLQSNVATMFGMHLSALTDWTTPSGNGSLNSYSSTNWAIGDYYQFQTPTTGVSKIGIQFDIVSSTTGPRDFKVQWSTDGMNFTDFANFMIQPSAFPSWSSAAAVAPAGMDTYNFDLQSITALDNAANIYLRLTMASTVAATPGATLAATSTNRVDNIMIYSDYDATMAPIVQPPAAPVYPMTGDVVFGIGGNRTKTTLQLIRPTGMGTGTKPAPFSPWNSNAFIRHVKFDNLGGALHNSQGNLLGVDTGASAAAGGNIYSFATQGSGNAPAGQLLANTAGTRLGGISVSPLNNKIAVGGFDSGRVIVYDYAAGNSLGTGSPSLTGRRESTTAVLDTGTLQGTGGQQGTAWLNNDTVLSFSSSGILNEIDSTTMVATQKASVTTPNIGQNSTALAYNPSVSPYVFAVYSGFASSVTQNRLFVFDPTMSYAEVTPVGGVNLSTSANTIRDIALAPNGDLFLSVNGAFQMIEYIPGAALNPAAIADNSSIDWYTDEVFVNQPSFNGFDIGFAPPASTPGDFNQDGKVNAADYVLWRRDPGSYGGPGGYATWRANFGNPPGSGAGLDGAAVPEPAGVVLVLIGLATFAGRRR